MMARRLSVLFLPHPSRPSMFYPWGEDVIAAVGDRHELRIFEYDQPLAPQFEGVDVVIDHGGAAGTHEMADLAQGQVKLWQVLGTGLDHFDLDYWRGRGIPVANAPGHFSAIALAEHAMMLILMIARKYPILQGNLKTGVMYEPMGIELENLSLGIIGFGASGRELARRARGFAMKIMAIDVRDVDQDEIDEFGLEFVGKPDAMDQVISQSDVLSIHLHLNAETHHIIDARRLGLMKPTALLINVARGALVDEAALESALVEGRLAGAGLDVFGQEPPDMTTTLFSLPNVIVTPHVSGSTDGTSRRRARCAADNIDRIAEGLEPLYRVD